MPNRYYLCIDMKTFYASVECAERGLNPFETPLAVADPQRGKNALCLAVSPKLKKFGVKNRCRISEIPENIKYIIARPRMQLYIDYCAEIYSIYLDYFSPDDIHTYSIDESFIDVTGYLRSMKTDALSLAKKLMNEIANRLFIPSTVGIGTNLYLAKVALDITAKHSSSHIGFLNEEIYKKTLWNHTPLTDFWMIGSNTAKRLNDRGIFTMRDIASVPEEVLYKLFGIDAELMIDHSFGRESCLMEDIKNYKSENKSVSFSQILPRDYSYSELETIIKEMILSGTYELTKRKVISGRLNLYIGYSGKMTESYRKGIKIATPTALYSELLPYAIKLYKCAGNINIPIRRVGISFGNIQSEECFGYDLFSNFDEINREKNLNKTVLSLYDKFGKNSLLRGMDFLDCSMQKERNKLIGGHNA